MALETTIRLICDYCRMPSCSFDVSTPDLRIGAIQELRRDGWTSHNKRRLGFNSNMCPACVAATHAAMKKGAA